MHRPTLAALALALALPVAAAAQAYRPGEPSRGLVAWYPLEGQAVDAITRAPAQAVGVRPLDGHDGQPRGALWFDGVRSYVSLGDRLQPERFTLAAWIRPDVVDRPQVVVSKIRNLPGHYQRNLELRLDPGGRLFLSVPSGNGWEAAQGQRPLAPGRWTHVAAVYDGARAQLYVDGVRDGAPLTVTYAQSRTTTFIGARPESGGPDGRTAAGPTFFFAGGIEDVRIWDRPLSDPEVSLVAQGRQDVPAPPPGRSPPPAPAPGPGAGAPIAWFPLDGDARDVAGQANGTVVGAARPAEDRRGDPRGALAFGGRDYVNLGVRVEPERFTISTWARPVRVDRDLVIFSKWSSAPGPRDRYLELRVDAGGRVTLAIPGGRGSRAQQVRSDRALAPGRWTHVAATFDGERAVLYIDGTADAEATFVGFDASQGPVFLGARPDASGRRARPGTFYEGRLDDLRVHSAALSDAEVSALAQERAPGPVPNSGPRPGDGDADEREAAFLVNVDRLVARYDAACVRRSARAVLEVEAQVFEALDGAERTARAERNQRISGFVRRALGELQGARGRTDAMSLDRKRSALSGLSEALWTDLVQDLDGTPLEADDRRDERSDRGGDVRRAGPWY